nr:hypothetical protein [Candidatus Sigynarchaeota archaeon]
MTAVPTRPKMELSTKVFIIIAIVATIVIPLAHYVPSALMIGGPLYEKRVCAFYYTWYGNQTAYYGESPGTANIIVAWDESHPELDPPIWHHPDINPYDIAASQHPDLNTSSLVLFDSCDPRAIRFHLDCATLGGIDTFICTWWSQDSLTNYNFRQVLNVTEMYNYTQRHTIYFETVQDRFYYNRTDGVTNVYNDLKYVIQNYGNHSRFLRIGDRPVIFVYATLSRVSVQNWTTVVQMLHADGLNPFLIADVGIRPIDPDLIPIFDGFHTYNSLGIFRDEPQNALALFETFVLSSRYNGKMACTTTLPGYNDTSVRYGTPSLERQEGEVYKNSWDVATRSRCDWALICTFNEWHEGTEIEPSLENGTYYIDMTRQYTQAFKA